MTIQNVHKTLNGYTYYIEQIFLYEILMLNSSAPVISCAPSYWWYKSFSWDKLYF